MAIYNRAVLVPYLQDVCSVEVLCSKIRRDIGRCEEELKELSRQADRKIVDPPKPLPSAFVSSGDKQVNQFVYVLIWFIIPIIIGVWIFSKIGKESIGFLIVCALVAFFVGGPGILDIIDTNKQEERAYQNALLKHSQVLKENAAQREQIPTFKQKRAEKKEELDTLRKQLSDARDLRYSVYSVSIIPSRYRNIHAAYYLYDYFRTCRESDLDKIIQTMLLDDIKQKLDKIIQQNEEIILNQRMQMALQMQTNHILAENHREQMQHITDIERNQERQIDYQRMIEQHLTVTNFFLASEYLQNSK